MYYVRAIAVVTRSIGIYVRTTDASYDFQIRNSKLHIYVLCVFERCVRDWYTSTLRETWYSKYLNLCRTR
jgi:hypothetical protein